MTPILRNFLPKMGIIFTGTITDMRKSATTLTVKINLNIHELMALFLGHSQKAHDKYYRVQLGHFGLSEDFENLESFQTNLIHKNLMCKELELTLILPLFFLNATLFGN